RHETPGVHHASGRRGSDNSHYRARPAIPRAPSDQHRRLSACSVPRGRTRATSTGLSRGYASSVSARSIRNPVWPSSISSASASASSRCRIPYTFSRQRVEIRDRLLTEPITANQVWKEKRQAEDGDERTERGREVQREIFWCREI